MPRVASVQMDVKYGDREGNVDTIVTHIRQLAQQSVNIVVFPECSVGGYCVSSKEACGDIDIPATSNVLAKVQSAVDETGILAIVGFAEVEGDSHYNTAALFSPLEPFRFYRKTHLPELGYDRYVTTGDQLNVFDTEFGKVGIQICFDIRFPEASRILALQGADVIFYPTNWPKGADVSADVLAVARAVENKVFVVTANRVGEENGFSFIGKSKIISPFGTILASAGNEQEILIADLDFSQSQMKRIVTIPGKHETTVFESRRPELYGPIFGHTVPITAKTL